MSHLKRHGGQRPRGLVAIDFKTADPIASLMIASHIATPFGNSITIDRLLRECIPIRDPVCERSGFKAKVQRPTGCVCGNFPRPLAWRLRFVREHTERIAGIESQAYE